MEKQAKVSVFVLLNSNWCRYFFVSIVPTGGNDVSI